MFNMCMWYVCVVGGGGGGRGCRGTQVYDFFMYVY